MYEQLKLFPSARRLFCNVVTPCDNTFKQEIAVPLFNYDYQPCDGKEWEYILFCNKDLAESLHEEAPKFGCQSDFELGSFLSQTYNVRVYGTREDMERLLTALKVADDLDSIAKRAVARYQKMLGRGYYISDYWWFKED